MLNKAKNCSGGGLWQSNSSLALQLNCQNYEAAAAIIIERESHATT